MAQSGTTAAPHCATLHAGYYDLRRRSALGSRPMKVVQFDDVTPVRGLEHRGGTFHSRTTAAGEAGTPGNFKFSVSELGTDYSGPRHRHNFDQFRFMLEGESDYGQDGPLKAGMLGYYP